MAGIGTVAGKSMLDFMLGGATPSSPSTRALGLCTATPVIGTLGEIGTGSGYARVAMTFAPATLTANTATNSNTASFGPFSSACTVMGFILNDTAATAGNNLMYGLLTTARTLGIGDSVTFAPGSLAISLS